MEERFPSLCMHLGLIYFLAGDTGSVLGETRKSGASGENGATRWL